MSSQLVLGALLQVWNLQKLGIPAVAITSLTPKDQAQELQRDLGSDPSLKLLYGKVSADLSPNQA